MVITMISNQTLYWLGTPLKQIPKRSKNVITKHFNIIELHNDVSIISSDSVNIIVFNFQKNNNDLLHICLKLCENLNKTLIIFHYENIDIEEDIDESNYLKINLNSSDLELEIKELKKVIFQSNLKNKQLSCNGTKVNNEEKSTRNIISIIKYIDDNLTNQLHEVDVAEYCHYSINYFSKLFHQEIGISFRDYVSSKRIGKARTLLKENNDIKIAIIAYQCGYHDVSYFSRIFKKKTGMTPSEYRKSFLYKSII